MWFLLALLLVLWVLSVHFYLPVWLSLALLALVVAALLMALLPSGPKSSTYIWKAPY